MGEVPGHDGKVGVSMQRAFEKIIERLRDSGERYEDIAFAEMNENGQTLDFEYAHGKKDAMLEAIEIVNQVASEYGGGWIPCSERLPEIEADVLLSLRSLDVYTGFRANTEGSFYVEGEGYVEFENVIAWQPLPEPYKAESEG